MSRIRALAPEGRPDALVGPVVASAVIAFSLFSGWNIARGSALLWAPLVLAILALYATVRPDLLFVGWLAVAPFIQESARETQIGWALTNAFYVLPIGVLLIRMARSNSLAKQVRWYDLLPVGYVCLIVLSQATLDSTEVRSPGFYIGLLHSGILVGPPLYYVCAFGPLDRLAPRHVLAALMGSAAAVGALGIIEHFSHWNLWGEELVETPPRIVVTLNSPAVLGAFLGVGIVTAVMVLVWNGPRSLRRLSIVVLALAVPALFFTYTRGGMIATVAVASLLIAPRRQARRIAAGAAVCAAIFLWANWSEVSSSSLYQQRAADVVNVRGRQIQAEAALDLAAQRPLLGWGYGQYDEAKTKSEVDTGSLSEEALYFYTSHNTFLTILVELGIAGIVLAFLPWLIIVGQTVQKPFATSYPVWYTLSLVGVIGVVVITAFTTDMRFFSFVPALAWIAVGLLRRGLWTEQLASGDVRVDDRDATRPVLASG